MRIGILASLKLGLSYLFPSWFYTPREIHNIREVFSVLLEESGYHSLPPKSDGSVPALLMDLGSSRSYLHLQATKPHTIGFALNDSPVGLAAYIIEVRRGLHPTAVISSLGLTRPVAYAEIQNLGRLPR